MAERARHAFGDSQNLDDAIQSGIIDAYDILFMDGDSDPKIGWLDKNGNPVIVENTTGLKTQVAELESEMSNKVSVTEVNEKINTVVTEKVETIVDERVETVVTEKVESTVVELVSKTNKYEITNAPQGSLIDYNDKEIRIMCPADAVWEKQTVGENGDPNCYYVTFKTYAPNDDAVGYIEHLGDQVDENILTSFSTDEYGRRYQPTWLAVANYDESADSWSYYGAGSTKNHYVGWDYQIDWYNADGQIIASDCIRINLSNEDCHSVIEPYYVSSAVEEKVEEVVETKVEKIVETKVDTAIDEKVENAVSTANAYTDAKIAEISEAASYEIIEF